MQLAWGGFLMGRSTRVFLSKTTLSSLLSQQRAQVSARDKPGYREQTENEKVAVQGEGRDGGGVNISCKAGAKPNQA